MKYECWVVEGRLLHGVVKQGILPVACSGSGEGPMTLPVEPKSFVGLGSKQEISRAQNHHLDIQHRSYLIKDGIWQCPSEVADSIDGPPHLARTWA